MSADNGYQGFSRGVLTSAVLAAATVGAFTLWLFSLDSTQGLLEWMPSYRRTFLYLLVPLMLPMLLLIPSLFSRAAKILSLTVSILVIVLTIGGFALLEAQIRKLPEPMPSFNKLDLSSDAPLVRLAFSSDPHFGSGKNNLEATASILRTINTEKFDAFFLLGDIGEMGSPGTDFDEAAALLAKELPDVPSATLMGNHDGLIGGAYRYKAFFTPTLYYRIDSGTTHIVALNLLWGTESFDKMQRKWLKKTLACIPKKDTTIVISHCFFWSSGYTEPETGKDWFDHTDTIAEIASILESSGVDLVVSGHNHFMEYIDRPGAADSAGTAYAIIGTMGGLPDQERTHISPGSKWYQAHRFGFLDLLIEGNRMELKFRDENGTVLHTVTR